MEKIDICQLIYIFNNESEILFAEMRNNRSPSFQNQYSHSPSPINTKKYYTRQEVSTILKATLQGKFTKLYKQLEQNQQIIKHLNEKLHHNDQLLKQYAAKSNQFTHYQHCDTQELIMDTVNKLLHDKLQEYWNMAQHSIENIRNRYSENTRNFQQKQQQRVDRKLTQIREICEESVGSFKKKNNAYWNKVKQTLGKIHNKITANEEKINNIGKQLAKYDHERTLNRQMFKDLQNGIQVAKNLVELKKSVNNVYNNFDEVLKLQQVIKDYFNNPNTAADNTTRICHRCSQQCNQLFNPETGNAQIESKTKGKSDDMVILEYSVQEQDNKRKFYNNDPYEFGVTEPLRRQSFSVKKNSYKNSMNRPVSSNKHQMNYGQGQTWDNQVMRSHGNYFAEYENENFETCSPITNKSSNLNESRENYQKRKTLKTYNQGAASSDSFNFSANNFSNNINSTGIYPSSTNGATSFMNFTLQSRKETIQNIKNRLIQLIDVKGFEKPLKVYIDHINYLKNEEGNYIFDLKGNMFKVCPKQFEELEVEGLLTSIIKVNQSSKMKIKRI